MQTVKAHRKQGLTLFFLIVVLSSYHAVFAEAETAKEHHADKVEWSGVYYGFTPCQDCQGIKTTLALNNNNSYILITQNVGKSPRETVEKGKFTWGNAENTLVLTPRKEGKTRQYFVGNDALIQLDDNGNRVTGKEAERYVLHRTAVTEPTQSGHSGH